MRTLIIIALSFIINTACGQKIIITHDTIIVTKDTLGADSLVQVFHSNGQLFIQVPYVNGEQNGWYEQYHENGTIWTKEFRINGQTVDGFYVELWDNGKISQKGYFKNGHQIGVWLVYDKEGNLFKKYIYNRKGEWIKLKIWNEAKKKWEKSAFY